MKYHSKVENIVYSFIMLQIANDSFSLYLLTHF